MRHKTKFSGKKENMNTGATRDNRVGKGRFDLISPFALKRLAEVYERGAVNHGDRNWENGVMSTRNLDSALRHINQYLSRENDEDHLAQAVWNLIAIIHFEETGRTELDDRPDYTNGKKKKK